MLTPTCPQNVDGASSDAVEPTLSNICWTPYIVLPLTLFKSDSPLSGPLSLFDKSDLLFSDFKKTDEESVGKLL